MDNRRSDLPLEEGGPSPDHWRLKPPKVKTWPPSQLFRSKNLRSWWSLTSSQQNHFYQVQAGTFWDDLLQYGDQHWRIQLPQGSVHIFPFDSFCSCRLEQSQKERSVSDPDGFQEGVLLLSAHHLRPFLHARHCLMGDLLPRLASIKVLIFRQ